MKTHQQLVAEGWEKRFIIEEPRLSECMELYESMGFEVCLLPLDEATATECDICFEGHQFKYKIIYTRKKG